MKRSLRSIAKFNSISLTWNILNGSGKTGLSFCYPEISDADKDIHSREGFDLALADKQATDQSPVVTNDFS